MALILPLRSYFHACVSNLAFSPDLSLMLKITLHVSTSTCMKCNLHSQVILLSFWWHWIIQFFLFIIINSILCLPIPVQTVKLIHKVVHGYLNAKFLKSCFQKVNIKNADKNYI